MSSNIHHIGIVEHIEGCRVRVVVPQQSACSGCHAKGVCGEQGKERVIEVETPNAEAFSVGERVRVALLHNNMAFSSVVWGYMLPLAVLIATLLILKGIGLEDGAAALLSIGAVGVYYAALCVFRNKIDKKIKFTIIKE